MDFDQFRWIAAAGFGFAATAAIYVLLRQAQSVHSTLGVDLAEAQQQARRELAAKQFKSFALFVKFLPAAIVVGRLIPIDSLKVTLSERYARAGWPGGLTNDELCGIAVIIGLIFTGFLGFSLLALDPILAPLCFIGIPCGFGIVSSMLNTRGKTREIEITRMMPYVLDLLALTAHAGAGFLQALERTTEDFADTAVGVELNSLLVDINQLGLPQAQALKNFAERAPVPVVHMFVETIIQSQELGSPIEATLSNLSERVRQRRIQDATESAGKAKVLVLAPGVLVLAAAMILLFAPFFVRWWYGKSLAVGE